MLLLENCGDDEVTLGGDVDTCTGEDSAFSSFLSLAGLTTMRVRKGLLESGTL